MVNLQEPPVQIALEEDSPKGTSTGQGEINPGDSLTPLEDQHTSEEATSTQLEGGEPLLDPVRDFGHEQGEDIILSRVYDQLACIDNMATELQQATQWPWFELKYDRLYQVNQDARTCKCQSQLVVPQCHQQAMLRLAHNIPAPGHLG